MTHLSRSKERGRFTINNLSINEQATDPAIEEMLKLLHMQRQHDYAMENDPEWAKHNLEHTLRTSEWIINKAKNSTSYAQNLYAAMCNNEFIEVENSWDILKENYWSVSWRRAGGIIADMIEAGDYIDWYCSGITGGEGYVSESVITDEIKEDLKKLGWVCVRNHEDI